MAGPMAAQMFSQLDKSAFKNTKLRSRKAIFEILDQAIEDDLDPAKIHGV
jgi:enoyl-CoA hydratase